MRGPVHPIPLTVLTGFLGAGKTTLLNRLLRDPDLADTVVVINEFGEVGLDHLLVEAADDDVVLLSAGCLCCTVRGDLVATLEDLLRRRDNNRITPFRRVIVETTGLADPIPILGAVLQHPYLSRRYALSGVVTLVDALHGAMTLDSHLEAVRQVAVADRLVLTKTDLADPAALAGLRDRLAGINSGASVITADHGAVPARDLVEIGPFDSEGKTPDLHSWLRDEATSAHDHGSEGHHGHGHGHDVNRHGETIRSFVLRSEAPVPQSRLDLFLEMMSATYGARLLRLKGIVCLAERPERPVAIHGVRHVVHVPGVLPAWPDASRETRLVLIVDGLDPALFQTMWNACLGRPMIDAPDAAALDDNPLAPPTLMRRESRTGWA